MTGKGSGLLGAVLAGGASRRFGRPKALEPLGGRPMAAWPLAALAPHAERVVVVGDPAVGRRLGLEARADRRPGRGPLEGLRSALRWAVEEGWEGVLVLPCDLPLVPSGLVGLLASRAPREVAAVVPASTGPLGVEPLCGRYGTEALAAVEEALEEGLGSAHGLLERLDFRVLSLEEVSGVADPATAFLNVNTPEAAERAGALLRGRPGVEAGRASTRTGGGGAPVSRDPGAGRLASLDAFRGLAIAGMILVNNPGSWSHIYPPLAHAAWHGWTPTDLVFPFFLFIVGAVIPFSFSRRLRSGHRRTDLFRHVVRRSAVLFLLGLGLNGFPTYDLSEIRIMGVLQRIAVVYLAAAGLYLAFGRRARALTAGALLLGYWALMTRVPVPGFGAGDLSPEGNLAGWVDRILLEGHLWGPSSHWGDPEGLLSTLPAVATALLGIFAGEWLRSERAPGAKARGLLLAGVPVAAAGWLWGLTFPVNKQLWTSSYVLLTAGIALLLLGALHWAMDVRGRRRWARPLVVYGMNAITVFVASSLMARILVLIRVGEGVPLKAWIYESLFRSWAGPLNGSLAFAVTYVLLWLAAMWVLYRKRIFLKV